jgi:hypothetical protein
VLGIEEAASLNAQAMRFAESNEPNQALPLFKRAVE